MSATDAASLEDISATNTQGTGGAAITAEKAMDGGYNSVMSK
jgi:hypothetical protein